MLGIIGAMDEEVARIKEQLTDVQVETGPPWTFIEENWGERDRGSSLRNW